MKEQQARSLVPALDQVDPLAIDDEVAVGGPRDARKGWVSLAGSHPDSVARAPGPAGGTRRILIPPAGERSMSTGRASGSGTKADPWKLRTPTGTSEYEMYRDETLDPPAIVCQVGTTQLRYDLRAIEDLHAMLKARGDWMPLGSADEQKEAAEGTVEAWGRSPDNPVGGWYGLKKGLRGRFGMYMPPLLEALGLAEVEHNPKNNRMRAL